MPRSLPLLIDVSPIKCEPLGSTAAMSPQDAVELAIRLKAMADPTRLRLMNFMLEQTDQEACTCDLAPAVGLSDPTVSHHLKKLTSAGLLTFERRGSSVYYRVVPEAIRAIARALHVDCC